MVFFEERRALSGPYTAAKFPSGEFLDADGPFQATAKLIWEWSVFISSPLAAKSEKHALSRRVTTPDQ
ncbi:hypothetical protein AVM02_09200 [Brucella anthropi]|uniref:hypothetical protein n=1 Tax=Brucella anthropi TaxID=529 RepID=UPI003987A81D